MIAVRDRLDEFGVDTRIVVVTFTEAANAATYSKTNELPFPVVVDPDRSAYVAYGLGRGDVRRVYGLRSGLRYLELLRTEPQSVLRRLRRPTEDTLQLAGDFVIAADGTLSYGFWGDGPDDRPKVDALLDAVRSAHERTR